MVAGNVCKTAVNIRRIDDDLLLREIGRVKGKLLQEFFEQSIETSCADVLRLLVDGLRQLRKAADGIICKAQRDALHAEQRTVLLDERVARLGEDALKVLLDKRLQLDANRKTPLQLGDKVRRFCRMKCPHDRS